MKRTLAALLLLTLVAPAWGQDYEKGLEAYDQHDYATALRELRPLAEEGHAAAQVKLAEMYSLGLGVPQDDAETAKWYRKAAEQGFAFALVKIGFMYEKGWGVPQDYAEAVKWYRKAEEQGIAVAQFKLGFMYDKGRGVPQDYVLAHKWINLFAARGGMAVDSTAKMLDHVASKMTPEQIAEAQRLAREWMAAFEKRKKN